MFLSKFVVQILGPRFHLSTFVDDSPDCVFHIIIALLIKYRTVVTPESVLLKVIHLVVGPELPNVFTNFIYVSHRPEYVNSTDPGTIRVNQTVFSIGPDWN